MSEIIHCTSDQPWDRSALNPGQRVCHHNTREVGDQEDGYPGGDIVTRECLNCGTRWNAELPQ